MVYCEGGGGGRVGNPPTDNRSRTPPPATAAELRSPPPSTTTPDGAQAPDQRAFASVIIPSTGTVVAGVPHNSMIIASGVAVCRTLCTVGERSGYRPCSEVGGGSAQNFEVVEGDLQPTRLQHAGITEPTQRDHHRITGDADPIGQVLLGQTSSHFDSAPDLAFGMLCVEGSRRGGGGRAGGCRRIPPIRR